MCVPNTSQSCRSDRTALRASVMTALSSPWETSSGACSDRAAAWNSSDERQAQTSIILPLLPVTLAFSLLFLCVCCCSAWVSNISYLARMTLERIPQPRPDSPPGSAPNCTHINSNSFFIKIQELLSEQPTKMLQHALSHNFREHSWTPPPPSDLDPHQNWIGSSLTYDASIHRVLC